MKDECVCEKYAEQRITNPTCMAFWCPVHDDIERMFASLERKCLSTIANSEVKPDVPNETT
jgi:hypothetical protein